MLQKDAARVWVLALLAWAASAVIGCGGSDIGTTGAGGGTETDTGGIDAEVEPPIGVTVAPKTKLVTSESATTATFTVVLDLPPTADVTIPLTSSDPKEGVVAPLGLTFTKHNWNVPQSVVVTGVDDLVKDGDKDYKIVLGAATSADLRYNGFDAVDVECVNTDNEAKGISVTPLTGLLTGEDGRSATFTIVLDEAPTDDVVISLSSSLPTEGVVYPTRIRFTPLNWEAPQVLTVTGVDDGTIEDKNKVYKILTAKAESKDPKYNGLDAEDVEVTNIDDDTPGFTVVTATGKPLVTGENGLSDTFTVVLNAAPSDEVIIEVVSGDDKEVAVTPRLVKFTPINWDSPQIVTVSGVDDTIVDGNKTGSVLLKPSTLTRDARYVGLDPDDVTVTNLDDETPGVTIAPTIGLVTGEDGRSTTFTLTLNAQPTDDVKIPLSVSKPEGVLDRTSVTFTTLNWNSPQIVTVTGVDDTKPDGNQVYRVVTGPVVSSDKRYSGFDPADVTLVNIDNESAGVLVSPLRGLTTTEAGACSPFTMVLTKPPTADVSFDLKAPAIRGRDEVSLSTSKVVFTPLNWDAAQTIRVCGKDDEFVDGGKPFRVLVGRAVTADVEYGGELPLDPGDPEGINLDNESPGVAVTIGVTILTTGELVTTENGDSVTFGVALTARPEPGTKVTIPLTSSNTKEGTVKPDKLVFTSDNWASPQTVTATGVDDPVSDGNKPYRVMLGAASSVPVSPYEGFDAVDVTIVNVDNDSASVTVTPTSGLVTSESGDTATFTVKLNSKPLANVTIDLTSSNTAEGTVSPSRLTFTPDDWAAAQVVTIRGVDDPTPVADGNRTYNIVTSVTASTDSIYNGLIVPDVTVTNLDNELPAVLVSPTAGLTTTEAGGTATFTLKLSTIPAANVSILCTSSSALEGKAPVAAFVFTPLNATSAQNVIVTGQDDVAADGNKPYQVACVATSTDIKYNGIAIAPVSLINTDNEIAGFSVTPTSGLVVSEAGTTDKFSVKLNAKPTGLVKLNFVSNKLTECTVAPASLTFTDVNWSSPQFVIVTGVNDDAADGNQPCSIKTTVDATSDPQYLPVAFPDVTATNNDNDSAGITLADTALLSVSEDGTTDSFTIKLNSKPTANVTCTFTSTNTAEGTVSPTSVMFDGSNFNGARSITITGVDDAVADGNKAFKIKTVCTGDTVYAAITVPDANVTNLDNDSAGVSISPAGTLTTTEAGGSATFSIKLRSKPVSNVTCTFTSTKPGEGFVSPGTANFDAANWNGLQAITVTGMNDSIADGNVDYAIKVVCTGDPAYTAIVVPNIACVNTDNDSPGVTIAPLTLLTTTESGATATFTMKLNSQPRFDVTCTATSLNLAEGTVAPASATFTGVNWKAPITFTVTGKDDPVPVADGNIAYSIKVSCTSADAAYNGMAIPNINAVNNDNDTPNITVTPVAGLVTTEAGGTATFTVNTTTLPAAAVTVALSSSKVKEGIVPATVVINPGSWTASGGVVVTVTGMNDDVADGDVAYTILTAASTSTDAKYAGINPPDVTVINKDNDAAGIVLSATSGLTTEAGGTFSVSVKLNSKPNGAAGITVTCPVVSSDITEGKVGTATSLVFNDTTWLTEQTVTITGVNDFVADGNIPYSVRVGPCVSTDTGYSGKLADVAMTNTDNDTPGVTVTPTTGLVTNEAGLKATFTMVLNSQPTASVNCGVTSSNTTEGTVSATSVTFTTTNWNSPQTITITGLDDATADGDKAYSIVTGACTSSDTKYNTFNPVDVSVINKDNDTAPPTVVGFPSAKSKTNKGLLGTNPVFSTTGDFVSESFGRTVSVKSLTVFAKWLNNTNSSCGAGLLNWHVLLNGVVVGDFSYATGIVGNQTLSRTWTFPAVKSVSGAFTISFEAQSTVCKTAGTWSWSYTGTTTLQ